MKVLVLGSGVVGVTSAYFLAQQGHEVTVVDRQPGPALETSFANAGQVSFGYSTPWAGPAVPKKAVKWMLMKYGPLVVRPRPDRFMWRWMAQMLRNCTHERYVLNKSRMLRVAEYSRLMLGQLRDETGIEYDGRMQGTLQLFRTQQQVDGAAEDIAVLEESGMNYEVLDRAGCARIEPALSGVSEKFMGGLRLPDDETGDCFMFTNALAELAAAKGVTFRYGTTIERIEADGNAISGVVTSQGRLTADRYVLALGSYSPAMARSLKLDIKVYPVKGYSITVPITDPDGAPVSTVMDETYKIAITRLGDRIRVGGTAEVSGFDLTLRPARRATLENSVTSLFPRGGDVTKATFWCGLRPMTPDGTPIIGPTRYRNLFLNTGHGTLGWTMSCGSARVLADLVSGRKPEIDSADLAISRYA